MRYRKHKIVLPILFMLLLPTLAFSQGVDDSGVFSDFVNRLQVISDNWFFEAERIAKTIFVLTVILELIFFGWSMWMKDRHGGGYLVQDVIQKLILIVMLGSLLYVYKGILVLAQEFASSGGNVVMIYSDLNPSLIIHRGEELLYEISKAAAQNLLSGFFGINFNIREFITFLLGLGAYIGHLIIAVQYTYLLLELIIVSSVGIIFVALMPFRLTQGLGEKYLGYIVNLAIKNFFFFLILGVLWQHITILVNDITNMEGLLAFAPVSELFIIVMLSVFLLGKLPSKMGDYVASNWEFNVDKLIPQMKAE
jgi:hypothetical protein